MPEKLKLSGFLSGYHVAEQTGGFQQVVLTCERFLKRFPCQENVLNIHLNLLSDNLTKCMKQPIRVR